MSGYIDIITSNCSELAAISETQNVSRVGNKINLEEQTSPCVNTTKAAHAMTDAVIANCRSLSNVVFENTAQSVEKKEYLDGLSREIGTSPIKSDIGTASDENALPSEINSRQFSS
jgi:hypothetical protein